MLITLLRLIGIGRIQHIRARWYRIRAWVSKNKINKQIGINSYVDPTVQVLRWNNVKIGNHSIISEGGFVNVNHRKENDSALVIGDYCYIGRRNFFNTGLIINIKDYCMTSVDCHFIGSGHVINDPFKPYIATGTTSDQSITIGVNCWLGAGASVIGNVTIGHGSIIGAKSFVRNNIPPFSIAVGNPAKVIKRFDIEANRWILVEEFSVKKEKMLPDENSYSEMLKINSPEIHMPWRAAGKSMGDML